jgi:hypothetical protein
MIKKIIALLTGTSHPIENPGEFHRKEKIEQELADERRVEAQEKERERLKGQREARQEPADEEILGPSET